MFPVVYKSNCNFSHFLFLLFAPPLHLLYCVPLKQRGRKVLLFSLGVDLSTGVCCRHKINIFRLFLSKMYVFVFSQFWGYFNVNTDLISFSQVETYRASHIFPTFQYLPFHTRITLMFLSHMSKLTHSILPFCAPSPCCVFQTE